MAASKPSSLRHTRRAALVLIILLGLVQGSESWLAYRHSLENVQAQLYERSLGAARQVEAGLRAVQGLLDDAAQTFHPHVPLADQTRIDRFRGRVRGTPEVVDMIIVGANGRILPPNLTDGASAGVDLSDREYFHYHRSEPRHPGVLISTPVVSRVVNRKLIPISRGLTAIDGSFAGLVATGVDPSFFKAILASVTPDDGGSAALLMADGTVLVRAPGGDSFIGQRVASNLDEVLRRQEFIFDRRVATLDQVERFVGYRALDSYPLVVTATLPVEFAMSEWRSRTVKAVLIFVVLSSAIWGFALVADGRERARMMLTDDLTAHRARLEQEVAERTNHLDIARAEAQSHGDRLALVLKGANDGWWDWDLVSGNLYYSPRWWSMLGYGNCELPVDSHLWRRLLHPGDSSHAEAAFGSALQGTENSYEVEFRLRHKDGHFVPVLSRGYVLRDSGGQPIRVSGTDMDLSERKRAENALRASEAKLRAMFELSPLGMIRNAMDGRFLEANQAFLAIVGRDLDGLNALGYWELTPERFAGEEQHQLAALRSRHAYGPYEKDYIHSSGRLVPVRLRGVLITGKDGESSIWSIVEDISEQRAVAKALVAKSEELARSNADLEQFAYVASHDLREPLRMVSSYVSLLERRYADVLDSDGREFIAFARDGAARLDHLVLDLLEFSRVKRQDEAMVPASAAAAITAALEILDDAVTSAGGSVVVAPDMPMVLAAPVQLQRVFQNLIGNALKYRHPDCAPIVRVSAAPGGDGEWVFTIADNGIGIAPEYSERIFGIFQRLHTHQQYEGTGIGLAICRSIVERHGGRIWVESIPGDGAAFHFTLKAA